LIEVVLVRYQDQEPQVRRGTITVMRYLLRNAFVRDVVKRRVKIVREACEVYAGRRHDIGTALLDVVLNE
jgi:RNase P protein component